MYVLDKKKKERKLGIPLQTPVFLYKGVYIVNNYPVTKNKPIYHVRISKQMKGRAFSEPFHLPYGPSAINRFIFGHGVSYSLYNATKTYKFREKKTYPM